MSTENRCRACLAYKAEIGFREITPEIAKILLDFRAKVSFFQFKKKIYSKIFFKRFLALATPTSSFARIVQSFCCNTQTSNK